MNKFSPVMDINLALMLEAEQEGIMPAKLMIDRGTYKTVGAANFWYLPVLSDSLTQEEKGNKIDLKISHNGCI